MAKYSNIKRLPKQAQAELFLLLVDAIAGKKKTEAAQVLRDLLSEQEAAMIARRMKIAILLENGYTYQQIRREIPVSDSTIAKIQLWLNTYGDGFRLAIANLEKNPSTNRHSLETDKLGWRKMKRKYPMYFWPQILLEEIVKSANKRERKRLAYIVNELHDKTPLTKELQKVLKQNYNTT